MYAIVRQDLQMSSGKLAAQAGHAFTDALYQAFLKNPQLFHNYRNSDIGGSKVVLNIKNEQQIVQLHHQLSDSDIPHALIIDSGHIMLPHFDGSPVITALGVGPCTKQQAHHFLRKLQCVR